MRKRFRVGVLAVWAAAAALPGANAETAQNDRKLAKTCQAAFESNRTTIEKLASGQNSKAIRRLLSDQGCPGATVILPGSQPSGLAKIKCTATLIPPVITCTFGMVAAPGQAKE